MLFSAVQAEQVFGASPPLDYNQYVNEKIRSLNALAQNMYDVRGLKM